MERPGVISRRALLGGLGAGLLLAACGDGGSTAGPSPTTAPPTSPPPTGGGDLNVQVTWPELIVGEDRFLDFVVLGDDNLPITDAEFSVVLRNREEGLTVGPVAATFYPDDRIPPKGLWDAVVSVDTPGIYDVEVTAADGRSGIGAVQVMAPEDSRAPAPGDVLPPIDTPTVANPQDLEQLCTREPDCSMHDHSLKDVIGQGQPVVLTIATPAFCSSALCGPVVDDVEQVKTDLGRDDVFFLHVEPFKDAGNTPTAIVEELELPTEPWTYVLDGDGRIVERFPGPVPPALLTSVIGRV